MSGKQINYKKLHELCFLDKEKIFNKIPPGHQSSLLSGFSTRLGKIEDDPFIGFIGKKYSESKTRVLLLGKSNAESQNIASDTRINESFNSFKKAKNNFHISYKRYSETYTKEMENWRIYWNVVHRFLVKAGLTLDDISYTNAVPFRYKGAPKPAHYIEAFPEFTNKFISIIKPDLLIPLGRDQKIFNGHIISEKYLEVKFEVRVHPGITRAIRDSYLPPQGEEDLIQAVSDFKNLGL